MDKLASPDPGKDTWHRPFGDKLVAVIDECLQCDPRRRAPANRVSARLRDIDRWLLRMSLSELQLYPSIWARARSLGLDFSLMSATLLSDSKKPPNFGDWQSDRFLSFTLQQDTEGSLSSLSSLTTIFMPTKCPTEAKSPGQYASIYRRCGTSLHAAAAPWNSDMRGWLLAEGEQRNDYSEDANKGYLIANTDGLRASDEAYFTSSNGQLSEIRYKQGPVTPPPPIEFA